MAVFRRSKRLEDWLQVARYVARQRQNVTFLLVGDGPEMEAVAEGVAVAGLQEQVLLTGFREDGRRLMGLMDVYLMTSDFEGLPMALLEAMTLGLPVVATAVGGIPEVIRHGEQGFLTPVGAVKELAGYVTCLLDDPDCRVRLGRAGAQLIEETYHTRQRVRAMEEVYLDLLANRGIGREP